MPDVPVPMANCPDNCRVTTHVPIAHVEDVDRSAGFYALLGFHCDNRFSGPDGKTNWAAMTSGAARIFFARASGPIDDTQQAVLFYMYSNDVMALRMHLLKSGLIDGGRFPSEPVPGDDSVAVNPLASSRKAVFRPTFPFYMPQGEIRVHDPDGYCILVGQLEQK